MNMASGTPIFSPSRYKIWFHNTFTNHFPSIEEFLSVLQYSCEDLQIDAGVWDVVRKWAFVVDENLCMAICSFILDGVELKTARLMYIRTCRKCKKDYGMHVFLRPDASHSPQCCLCRKEEPLIMIPKMNYCFASVNRNTIFADISMLHEANFTVSVQTSWPVLSVFDTIPFEREADEEGNKRLKLYAEQEILDAIHVVEGNIYESNGGNKSRAEFRCSQRLRGPVKTDRHKKARVVDHKRNFHCGGCLYISLTPNKLTVTVQHTAHHELLQSKVSLAETDLVRVKELFQSGLAPYQILSILREETGRRLTYSTVYNAWKSVCQTSFAKDADPLVSAVNLLRESDSLEEIMVLKKPFTFAFTTQIGREFVSKYRIEELFIDSTFKTNGQKLEVFCVIGSLHGTGFPIAYLFLASSDGKDDLKRMDVLALFLQSLRRTLPSLSPSFFFSDKDKGQMHGIRVAFRMHPSLCIWHMKRAIKKKIASMRTGKLIQLSDRDEQHLFRLIDSHYNSHQYLDPSLNKDRLHSVAVREIILFLLTHKSIKLLGYLMREWYNRNNFELWGRRSISKIALARTTMLVEGHWSMMKRSLLQCYNRPRVDMLLHIIERSLLPKIRIEFGLIFEGSKKPYWWKSFVAEWKRCLGTLVQHVYKTDFEAWTCTCPAYRRSPFLLCKHLVRNQPCPYFRDVCRYRQPPFMVFCRRENVYFANIDNEIDTTPSGHFTGGVNTQNSAVALNNAPLALPEQEQQEGDATEDVTAVVEMKNNLTWLSAHIDELSSSSNGQRQLLHVQRTVLERISRYRQTVQNNLTQRRAPRTWEHPDTVNLQ